MIKNIQAMYKLFIIIFLISNLSLAYAEKDIKIKPIKKAAKIMWHCAEIWAGYEIGYHWLWQYHIKNRVYNKHTFGMSIITASLFIHVILGLSEELKDIQQWYTERMAKKENI